VSAGAAASHVLPVVGGRYAAAGTVRVDVRGGVVASTLHRRLQLLHPEVGSALREHHADSLVAVTSHVSLDFDAEVGALRADAAAFDAAVWRVRLPRAAAAVAAAAGPPP